MRSRVSAGLLVYRVRDRRLDVFLAHPGGPLFTTRDEGYWTIPKGEVDPGEDLLATALREFEEEIGIRIDSAGPFLPLDFIQQKGGKIVHAWGVEKDWDDSQPIRSNRFQLEWPPRSGRFQEFPEVDRAQFFPIAEARRKVKDRQVPLLDRLEQMVTKNIA